MLLSVASIWRYVEPSRDNVGPFWSYVEPAWGQVGRSWGHVGPSWGSSWAMLGHLGTKSQLLSKSKKQQKTLQIAGRR